MLFHSRHIVIIEINAALVLQLCECWCMGECAQAQIVCVIERGQHVTVLASAAHVCASMGTDANAMYAFERRSFGEQRQIAENK